MLHDIYPMVLTMFCAQVSPSKIFALDSVFLMTTDSRTSITSVICADFWVFSFMNQASEFHTLIFGCSLLVSQSNSVHGKYITEYFFPTTVMASLSICLSSGAWDFTFGVRFRWLACSCAVRRLSCRIWVRSSSFCSWNSPSACVLFLRLLKNNTTQLILAHLT